MTNILNIWKSSYNSLRRNKTTQCKTGRWYKQVILEEGNANDLKIYKKIFNLITNLENANYCRTIFA